MIHQVTTLPADTDKVLLNASFGGAVGSVRFSIVIQNSPADDA
jgi:hypothetical protein